MKEEEVFYLDGHFIKMNAFPFAIGKVVKIMEKNKASDFFTKSVDFIIGTVPGVQIFIVFTEVSQHCTPTATDKQIAMAIRDMCLWYQQEKVIGNKSIEKRYKSQL